MCDVAYALMVEDLARRLAVETQAALFARMHGADVRVPDPFEVRERFDELLCSVPDGEPDDSALPDSRDALMREAFGLPRKRG